MQGFTQTFFFVFLLLQALYKLFCGVGRGRAKRREAGTILGYTLSTVILSLRQCISLDHYAHSKNGTMVGSS